MAINASTQLHSSSVHPSPPVYYPHTTFQRSRKKAKQSKKMSPTVRGKTESRNNLQTILKLEEVPESLIHTCKRTKWDKIWGGRVEGVGQSKRQVELTVDNLAIFWPSDTWWGSVWRLRGASLDEWEHTLGREGYPLKKSPMEFFCRHIFINLCIFSPLKS